ncbi:hypothetical protein EJ04DRAFT_464586, partial [Polyplosphaeria fusca]
MADLQQKAEFIKIPPPPDGTPQTQPVEPSNRIPSSEITISLCTPSDLPELVDGFYLSFSPTWFARMEPPALRPSPALRRSRLASRLLPSFSTPGINWVKATLNASGKMIGVAGWAPPSTPIHNVWRRSAAHFYGWKDSQGWSDADVADMWAGTDIAAWDAECDGNDKVREEVMGGERHWYLAPLFVWPEWQGRGVGRLLLEWAMERADGEGVPMYLESAPHARAVYMRV